MAEVILARETKVDSDNYTAHLYLSDAATQDPHEPGEILAGITLRGAEAHKLKDVWLSDALTEKEYATFEALLRKVRDFAISKG